MWLALSLSCYTLPKRWEAKMTAISEARDLKVLTLEELFGSLIVSLKVLIPINWLINPRIFM